jgi:hypothetical protein
MDDPWLKGRFNKQTPGRREDPSGEIGQVSW